MRVTKTGYYRNRGTSVLINKDISSSNLMWDDDNKRPPVLRFEVNGKDASGTYEFVFELTLADLRTLLITPMRK